MTVASTFFMKITAPTANVFQLIIDLYGSRNVYIRESTNIVYCLKHTGVRALHGRSTS